MGDAYSRGEDRLFVAFSHVHSGQGDGGWLDVGAHRP